MNKITNIDFFVSYAGADHRWAEWIAWTLEHASYKTIIQAWDFRPGSNFVNEMQRATKNSERIAAVISDAYLKSDFCSSEWYSFFRKDPKGEKGYLVPIRVEICDIDGLLPQVVYIDLVGLNETEATEVLLSGVRRERAKPTIQPPYPAESRPSAAPLFPGEKPKPVFPPDANLLGKDFVWINPGRFLMGSPESEWGRRTDERLHEVTITEGYFMQRCEVTQKEFVEVMGMNPSNNLSPMLPVENVSWEDAMEYCRCRTENDRAARLLSEVWCYSLPTEAQWEYACRGGLTSAFIFGNYNFDDNELEQFCYFDLNSGGNTNPVGYKKSNHYGLFDMCGNVLEWCLDWYDEYPDSALIDPRGPQAGSKRVLRGGAWGFSIEECRFAARFSAPSTFRGGTAGIRLVAIKC